MATLDPQLSAAMCWDAVAQFGARTGAIPHPVGNPQTDLVGVHDASISGPQELQNLPAGHSLGFFDGDKLAHVMVSTGDGKASGNKNSCIGVGEDIGWENLDLRTQRWQNGGIVAPGLHTANRILTIRHRPLDQAGQTPQQQPQLSMPPDAFNASHS